MVNQKTGSGIVSMKWDSRDLPLCCPSPDAVLWNAHPRVYLPIEQTGRVVCPYCSTEYVLTY